MEHFIFDVGQENDDSPKLRGFLDIVNQNIFIYDDINASILFTIGGSGGVGTLSQVLATGNATGGLPIIITSGDTINFSVGLGGILNSAGTSISRSWLLPDADGTIALLDGGQTFTSATWNGTVVDILYGGSGQTTANDALNAFLPSQAANVGKFLQTDGTNTSWVDGNSGTMTDYSHSFLLMGG